MKSIFFLLVGLLILLSCKQQPTNNAINNRESEVFSQQKKSDLTLLGCYAYTNAGDRVRMEITEVGTLVKGTLAVRYNEKDANTGSFIGQVYGDTLVMDYTFQSEGLNSTRQMAYLVLDNKLLEGYGELNAEGTAFKDLGTLEFLLEKPLVKTDCNDNMSQ